MGTPQLCGCSAFVRDGRPRLHLCPVHEAAPALLAALEALKLECLADPLNPCWDGRPSDVVGRHWGGGAACSSCVARAAIAQARGGVAPAPAADPGSWKDDAAPTDRVILTARGRCEAVDQGARCRVCGRWSDLVVDGVFYCFGDEPRVLEVSRG